jgi:4-carboxymuconolactone decarboxylase
MAESCQQLVGKRRRIDGMYRSLFNHPDLIRHGSDLGIFLRFGSGALPMLGGNF